MFDRIAAGDVLMLVFPSNPPAFRSRSYSASKRMRNKSIRPPDADRQPFGAWLNLPLYDVLSPLTIGKSLVPLARDAEPSEQSRRSEMKTSGVPGPFGSP
jgi:hypothetical protein